MVAKIPPLKKWQPFNATTFVTLMWPSLFLWKIQGFFPYNFKTSTKIVVSRCFCIYSVVSLLTYISLFIAVMYHMDITKLIDFQSVPARLQGNAYFVLAFWITITSVIQSKKCHNFLVKLAKESLRIPAGKFKKLSRIIHTKDFMSFLFIYSHFPNIYSSSYALSGYRSVGMYSTLMIYLVNVLYVNCVLVISAHFELINEKLLKLKCELTTDERHLLRRVYHTKKNPLIMTEIQRIVKEQNDVSNLVNELNDTFSLQLIGAVTLTFAEITFSLYFYILKSVGVTDINQEKQLWYSYFISSVTYYTVYIILTVGACEHAKDASNKTGIILHEILNDTFDKQVIEELQIFSLQLLHRDNNFVAKGLKLDYALLTSIAGGVTTYLLILIQFLLTTNQCSNSKSDNYTTTMSILTENYVVDD